MSGMPTEAEIYKRKCWSLYRRLDQPGRKIIMKAIMDTEV